MKEFKLNLKRTIAEVTYKVAENSANITSCFIIHQPKVPNELKKLSKVK